MSFASRSTMPVLRGGGSEHCLELARRHQQTLGASGGRAGQSVLGEAVPGQHQFRLRVAQVERHLTGLEQHVHRHHHGAGPQDAVIGRGKLRHVGQHDADPVAGPHAAVAQQPGHPGAGRVELRIRQHQLAEPDRGRGTVTGYRGGKVKSKIGHYQVFLSCAVECWMALRVALAPGGADRGG